MILFYCALRARQLPIKFDGSDRTNVIQQIDHNFPLSLTLLIVEMMSTMFKTKVKPRGATEWFHCRVVSRVFFLFLLLFEHQLDTNPLSFAFLPKISLFVTFGRWYRQKYFPSFSPICKPNIEEKGSRVINPCINIC